MIPFKALNLVHFLLRRRFEVFSSWRRLMCQTGNLQGRRTKLREKQTSRLFLQYGKCEHKVSWTTVVFYYFQLKKEAMNKPAQPACYWPFWPYWPMPGSCSYRSIFSLKWCSKSIPVVTFRWHSSFMLVIHTRVNTLVWFQAQNSLQIIMVPNMIQSNFLNLFLDVGGSFLFGKVAKI